MISRRALIAGGAAGAGGLLLGGCDQVIQIPAARRILFAGEDMQKGLQRALSNRAALAPEYTVAQMSPIFRSNGTADPDTAQYNGWVEDRFAGYRLAVNGLVERPLSLSLAQIRSMPARSQITRHDCVEGWSAIGQWTGPLLGTVLKAAGVSRSARYVVFTCADLINDQPYYESIDMVDAFHPQTILAWGMNGAPLEVAHGAPLRLRVERQLGYKQAKYITSIAAVSTLAGIGKGQGGYWEDNVDYDWYAGI